MLKIVSWNIAHRPDAWRALVDTDADIALLQEACEPPSDVASRFDVGTAEWRTHGGRLKRPWRAALVSLTRRIQIERIPSKPLADAEPHDFAVSRAGTLDAGHVVDPESGVAYTLISMYAAWERSHVSAKASWIYADASAHRVISDISVLVGREKGSPNTRRG